MYDMLHIVIPGKIKYCKRYWLDVSGFSETSINKWESKSPFKLYNKIDKIIAEYNTL